MPDDKLLASGVGMIAVGKCADMLVLDRDLNVLQVHVEGKRVV